VTSALRAPAFWSGLRRSISDLRASRSGFLERPSPLHQ
jgi:hypothetical protein